MKIDYTEITVKLMEDYTAKYLQENAELVQDTIKATQEALAISRVVGQSEQLKCVMKHDDGNCNCDIEHCEDGGW